VEFLATFSAGADAANAECIFGASIRRSISPHSSALPLLSGNAGLHRCCIFWGEVVYARHDEHQLKKQKGTLNHNDAEKIHAA
jgi:hypothetical protein